MSLFRKTAGRGLPAAASAAMLLALAPALGLTLAGPAQAQSDAAAQHQFTFIDKTRLKPEMLGQIHLACRFEGRETESVMREVLVGVGTGRGEPLRFPECRGAGALTVNAIIRQDADPDLPPIRCNMMDRELPATGGSYEISFPGLGAGRSPYCWMAIDRRS